MSAIKNFQLREDWILVIYNMLVKEHSVRTHSHSAHSFTEQISTEYLLFDKHFARLN